MTAVSAARRSMIAKVHLGAKQLGLNDETRRDLMERVTGRRSAADCTDRELAEVLAAYRARGWTPTLVQGGQPQRSAKPARGGRTAGRVDHPYARKARALWLSLHDLGVVRDASESALEHFACRQLGVERMVWADQTLAYKLIEPLKVMANRAGWLQYLGGIPPRNQVRELLRRLAIEQAHRLAAAGKAHPPIGELASGQIEELRPLIAAMGVQIRALPAPADAEGAG